jgi:hypothetical protein
VPKFHKWPSCFDHPFEILVIGGYRFPLPGRDVRHDFEGAFLDRRGALLALVERRRLEPLGPEGLDLVVLDCRESG